MRLSVATRRKKHGEKGFTLVETASALLVMMIGGLESARCLPMRLRTTPVHDRALALAVAQQEMERYRQVTFVDAH